MAIEVRCDHCGRTMMLKDSCAGKRGRCPHCNGDILVPALSATKTESPFDPDFFDEPVPVPSTEAPKLFASPPAFNPPPVVSDSPPNTLEDSIYRDSNVNVTATRVVVSGTTYALRNITSVKMGETPPKEAGPVVMIILGSLIALGGLVTIKDDFGSGLTSLLIGSVMIFIGMVWYRGLRINYHLIMSSSSGEVQAFTSENRTYIQQIVEAVSEAIVRHK